MSDLIVQLDAKSFRTALKDNIVLVDFWEPWCGPCQIQLPVLEEVARRVAGRATVAKVNVDDAQKLAVRFGIQSIPTLVLFKNGKVIHQFVGSHSAKELTAAIEQLVGQPSPGIGPHSQRRVNSHSSKPRE
jgi:thioredoxin 1